MEKFYQQYVNCKHCMGLPGQNKPIEIFWKMREDKIVKKRFLILKSNVYV